MTEAVEGPIFDPFENKAPSSSLLGIFESKARSPVSFPRNDSSIHRFGWRKSVRVLLLEERDTRSHPKGESCWWIDSRLEVRPPLSADLPFLRGGIFFFSPSLVASTPRSPEGTRMNSLARNSELRNRNIIVNALVGPGQRRLTRSNVLRAPTTYVGFQPLT